MIPDGEPGPILAGSLALLDRLGIDEPMLRTNPAWCAGRLAAELGREAIRGPLEAIFRRHGVPTGSPGVVGLLVAPTGEGLVTHLIASMAPRWSVGPRLPFRVETLQGCLAELLRESEVGLAGLGLGLELIGFRVEDTLGRRAFGSSMNVAAVLALVKAASGGDHPRFLACCSVVEPGGDGSLRPVEGVGVKLGAFVRELGEGSLLVRLASDREAARFDSRFGAVWPVRTWADLAQRLGAEGLLDPFLATTPLDRHRLEIARERVRALAEDHQSPARALELARRLAAMPLADDVPAGMVDDVRRAVVDLYRHVGQFETAARASRAELNRHARKSSIASYDDQARAAAALAAALFDAHRFVEAGDVLGPWSDRIAADPRLVAPSTRVMIHNTLGRAKVVTGRGYWEADFRRSLEIQKALAPFESGRTRNYLIQGLLRSGRLAEAEREIRELSATPGLDRASAWFLHFERADLARRRGEVWSEPEMEGSTVEPGRAGHAFGFYFQATARQPGRSPEDSVARLALACRFLLADVRDDDPGNILLFLTGCLDLAAAASAGDRSVWSSALGSTRNYLGSPSRRGLARHYRPALAAICDVPDPAASERLLGLIPYF